MQNLKSISNQKGAVVILMAFIIGLAVTAYMLHALDPARLRVQQDKKSSLILGHAKEAIISYSVSRTGAGDRPGNMPIPDYFAGTEVPFNYDGDADGGCLNSASANGLPLINSGSNMRCLGRLPWRTIGMGIEDTNQNDTVGNKPWYAVSANLVDPLCLDVLNPSILNSAISGVCAGSALPHQWLTVRDISGNVVSNRVAVVLMMPRTQLTVQSRPTAPLNGLTSYLDAINVPAGCAPPCVPGNYSNADFDDDFVIMGNSSATGNDNLVYITIDELIDAVSRRVSSDASIMLNKYNLKNTHFPYAAPLGSLLNNFVSSGTSSEGMLPIDVTDNCSCTSATSCSCSFSPITSVAFTRTSGTSWTSNTGSCTRAGATCTCNGSGTCTRGARIFSCNSGGLCTHNITGINTYTYSVPSYADIYSQTANCTIASNQAACIGAGSFSIGLIEPSWFKDNLWQDYLYYEWSTTSNLQLGSKGNLGAILINAGAMSTSETGWVQTRPTSDVRDYLDSIENTNNDNNFEAGNKQKSGNYNDQPFVVAP